MGAKQCDWIKKKVAGGWLKSNQDPLGDSCSTRLLQTSWIFGIIRINSSERSLWMMASLKGYGVKEYLSQETLVATLMCVCVREDLRSPLWITVTDWFYSFVTYISQIEQMFRSNRKPAEPSRHQELIILSLKLNGAVCEIWPQQCLHHVKNVNSFFSPIMP